MRKHLLSFFLIFVGYLASAQILEPQVEIHTIPNNKTAIKVTVVPKGTGTQSVHLAVTGNGYNQTFSELITPSKTFHTFEVTGLLPSATYNIVATASRCPTLSCTAAGLKSVTRDYTTAEDYPIAAILNQEIDNCPQFAGISWKYATTGAPVYSVNIQKSYDGSVWHNVAHLSSSETSYYDSGVIPGVHHTYRIITLNSIGDQTESNRVTIQVKPYIGPDKAINFRSDPAQKTNSVIRLTWENPQEDACGSNTRASWYVMMKRSFDSEYKIVGVTYPNATHFDVWGLSQNETIQFGLFPISNQDKFGDWVYLTDKTYGVSSAPLSLTGVAYKDAINNSVIGLQWVHNLDDVDFFTVDVSTDGKNFSQLGIAKSDIRVFRHVNISEGVPYTYRIKAANYLYGESDWTYMDGYVTYDYSAIPNAPYGLLAKWSGSNVVLSWIDDSNKEEGFIIEKSSKMDGVYQEIGKVGRGITTYTDPSMNGDTTYYRVKAENPLGISAASKAVRIIKPAAGASGFVSNGTAVGILAYPNPTVDRLNISIPNELQGETVALKVYNSANTLVYTKRFAKTSDINVDFKRFTPGVYNVVVETGSTKETKKIVKN